MFETPLSAHTSEFGVRGRFFLFRVGPISEAGEQTGNNKSYILLEKKKNGAKPTMCITRLVQHIVRNYFGKKTQDILSMFLFSLLEVHKKHL